MPKCLDAEVSWCRSVHTPLCLTAEDLRYIRIIVFRVLLLIKFESIKDLCLTFDIKLKFERLRGEVLTTRRCTSVKFIHLKLLKYSLFYVNIYVTYAVRNFIFDIKIYVTIARLFIILRAFSSKVPASVHYFT